MRPIKKPKILFVVNSFDVGGVAVYLSQIANMLTNFFRISILRFDNTSSTKMKNVQNLHIVTRTIRMNSRIPPLQQCINNAKAVIGKFSPSIVHALNLPSYIIAPFASVLSSVPVVISQRDTADDSREYKHYLPLIKRSNKLSDAIIAVSDTVRNVILKYEKVDAKKIIKICYGIPAKEIFTKSQRERLKKRKEFGIAPNQIAIGVISRLIPEKTVDYFLKSAKQIIKHTQSVKFFIIGYGPEEWKLKALAKHLNITKYTVFTGIRHDVPELLGMLDIVVCPSTCKEGLSIAMLEAMAAAKPLVCANVKSTQEVLTNEKHALLVKQKNVSELTKATLTLINDGKARLRLGKAAYRHIKNNFNIENTSRQLTQLYNHLLKR